MYMKNDKNNKVVSISWTDESDRCIIVPGSTSEKRSRIRELRLAKSNCHFAAGVPRGIIDFIYRSVKKLKLDDKKIFFSRGVVKRGERNVKNSVSIHALDWDVGIHLTIPRSLKYRETIELRIENKDYTLRVMELLVLNALLRISTPGKKHHYYSAMPALILARGWKELGLAEYPEIYRKPETPTKK